jgi:hypothetical protein
MIQNVRARADTIEATTYIALAEHRRYIGIFDYQNGTAPNVFYYVII